MRRIADIQHRAMYYAACRCLIPLVIHTLRTYPRRAHERQNDHRIFQSLGAVEGHDFQQRLITLQADEMFFARLGVRHSLLQPALQSCATTQTRRFALQHFTHVTHIGEQARAIGCRQPAPGEFKFTHRGAQHREHAPRPSNFSETMKAFELHLPTGIVSHALRKFSRAPTAELARQHRAHPGIVVRIAERDQQQSHQPSTFAGKHTAAIEEGDIPPPPGQSTAHGIRFDMVTHENGQIAGREGRAIQGVFIAQQRIDALRGNARHALDHRALADRKLSRQIQMPKAQRRLIDTGVRKASVFLIQRALHWHIVDTRQQKLRRLRLAIQRIQTIGQARRRAAGHTEAMRVRSADCDPGIEIAEYVRAAKTVDGLLRIADQHAGGVTGDGIDAIEDSPLQGIRILKLIDHRNGITLPQFVREPSTVRARQRRRGARQHIIRRQQPAPGLLLYGFDSRRADHIAQRTGAELSIHSHNALRCRSSRCTIEWNALLLLMPVRGRKGCAGVARDERHQRLVIRTCALRTRQRHQRAQRSDARTRGQPFLRLGGEIRPTERIRQT